MRQQSPAKKWCACRDANVSSSVSTINKKGLSREPRDFRFLGVLVGLSVLVSSQVRADPRTVTHNGEATNSTAKSDFHIGIASDTAQNVTKADLRVNNAAPIQGTVTAVEPDFQAFVVDWDANIPANSTVEWEVRFEQNEENFFEVTSSYFTPRGIPPVDLPLAGVDVDHDGTIYLVNGGTDPIVFNNLTFEFPDNLNDEFLRMLLANPSSGLAGLLTAGTVPAGDEMLVAEFPDLRPGDFLAARLDVTSTVNQAVVPQVLGHEHQAIPEPATLLLAFGYVLTAAVLIRFRRVS